tara:strand:- start:213 stop:533 length:321 start_codon:yes stop_codon:yes gene_type:complete
MKKIFNLTFIIISILALNSCGTVSEGFSSQKKNSIDEFLVEKKSPLVMPPDFNELPLPKQINQINENEEETNLRSLLTDKNESQDNQDINQNTNFENSIIEKIKNN